MSRKNVLIVEADRDAGELFARALEIRRDCKCYLAIDDEEAVDLMNDIPFDLLIIDLGIAVKGDFRIIKRVKRLFPGTVVIVGAYLHQKTLAENAKVFGAQGFIIKPIKLDTFRKAIEQYFPRPVPTSTQG